MVGMSSRRRLLAGAGAALSAALAGCSGLTPFVGKREESTERVPVDGASALAVAVDVGDVTVRTADREDVHVDVVKQSSSMNADLSKLEFRVERPRDRVRLRGVWTGNGGLSGKPSLDLDVTVPSSLAVAETETQVGDVDVEGVTGDVSASTSTGDVTVRSVAGAVSAETSTGDVTVEDVDAFGGAETSTGDVTVEVPAIGGDTAVQANTGDVTAAIGADVDAELRASTSTGDVAVNDLSLADGSVDERSASGTLGDGGPLLEFETSTGDVTLSALE
ncbi:DUF4097 family beta strand repeat-containing protein [Halorubellus sp. PRR65]|uniref:DUF4097 family beta strand repeat-containing protein n=1 Tax=Halorubellus sp. PRR65 TaxID=3098148 RepID=UPI002B25D126|nr:DUF4097 family beta strand repeat-containing protein [Halorubellus sp. PRR65]